MMEKQKEFKVGDSVYFVNASSWKKDYRLARKERVRKVYKNGNFVLDHDYGVQFRPNGSSTGGCYSAGRIEHETPELLQAIERAKTAYAARAKSWNMLDKLRKLHAKRDVETDIKIATVLEREFPELVAPPPHKNRRGRW